MSAQPQAPEGPFSARTGQRLIQIAAAALVAGVATVIGRHIGSQLDADHLERTADLVGTVAAVFLLVRFCLRTRDGYLKWVGNQKNGWTYRKRRKLRRWTLTDGTLSLALLGATIYFYLYPAGAWQLLPLVPVIGAILILANKTKRLITPNGPPPLSKEIQDCGLLNDLIGRVFPPYASKILAVMIVASLWFSVLSEGAAVALRLLKTGSDHVRAAQKGHQEHRSHNHGESSAGQSTTVLMVENPPTLDELCGTSLHALDAAGEPYRRELLAAWASWSPADGCPARTERLPADTTLVFGACQGSPRSLGIVSELHKASILLEDAATKARAISRESQLRGASPRIDMAGGDFHVLFTRIGPYLLIREEKTDGEGATSGAPLRCTDIHPGGEEYTVLPPGMAELYGRFNQAVMPTWPSAAPSDDGSQRFVLHTASGIQVAEAWCETPLRCKLESEYTRMRSGEVGIGVVTGHWIFSYGPR